MEYLLIILHLGTFAPSDQVVFPNYDSCFAEAINVALHEPNTSAICFPRTHKA